MAEALTVIKALFADGPVDHEGEHYRITGLEGTPKPVQRPHPPIVIGGGGPRVLALAAREADIVGLNVNLAVGVIDERAGPNATEEATQAKVDVVREAAGDRFDDLELQVRVHAVVVTDDRQGMAELLAPALGISPAAALASPHALAGIGRRDRRDPRRTPRTLGDLATSASPSTRSTPWPPSSPAWREPRRLEAPRRPRSWLRRAWPTAATRPGRTSCGSRRGGRTRRRARTRRSRS